MGCVNAKPNLPPIGYTDKELIEIYLNNLNKNYKQNETLYEYVCRLMQDVYYGDKHIPIEEEIIINKLWKLVENNKSIADHNILYFFEKDQNLIAKKKENNMVKVLDENPHLKKWFMEYDPPHYLYDSHPNMICLEELVHSDEHTGASLALTCRTVKRRLSRQNSVWVNLVSRHEARGTTISCVQLVTMEFSQPLGWVHEDPHHVIRIQMEVDGNNYTTDILGIGPSMAYNLEDIYGIKTINDLTGYIMYNGFPQDINFKEETKFILSVRCANRLMKNQ